MIFSDVTCPVCACLCDDLRVTVEAGRVVHAERACSLAEPWFLQQDSHQTPIAEIERLVRDIINSACVAINADSQIDTLQCFRPSRPVPTHRILEGAAG